MSDEYDWSDYESAVMFPGCDCGHDATDHEAAWSEMRPEFDTTDGCMHCPCEVTWEHA